MSDRRFTTDDLMVELKYSNDIREIIENAVNKFQSSLSAIDYIQQTEQNIMDRVQCLQEKLDSNSSELKTELAKERANNSQLSAEIKSLNKTLQKLNQKLLNCGVIDSFPEESVSATSSFESLDVSNLFEPFDIPEGLKIGMRLELDSSYLYFLLST